MGKRLALLAIGLSVSVNLLYVLFTYRPLHCPTYMVNLMGHVGREKSRRLIRF